MTKTELVKMLQKATNLTLKDTEEILERLGDIMAAELLAEGEVPLPRVGKLIVKETAPRKGRNPRTGAAIDIPAGRKVGISLSGEFKASFK